MKRITAILVSAILLLALTVPAFALTQPFETGTLGCEKFRIPAIFTLNDGSIITVADIRHDHGSDAPGNLDTLSAVSSDCGETWEYVKVNYLDDCAYGTNDWNSASYIDSAVVQSKETGRIFVATSSFPSGCGTFYSEAGTGYIEDENGVKRLALTDKAMSEARDISDYEYYIGDFEDGFARVIGAEKNYTVDENLCLYLDGEPLYMTQKNSTEQVRQNIYYEESHFHMFPTCYLSLKYSDDNGKTWSAPVILNPLLKEETETFYGICPGRGFVTTVNGKERIIFCAYDNSTGTEKASTLYSDDNGRTWNRGQRLSHEKILGKSSESQIISMPDGSLRIFSRNTSKYIGTAVSRDGGVTWTKLKADKGLYCTLNCMVSFINTSKTVNGKQVVLGSYSCGGDERKNGIVRTGLMGADGKIQWIKTFRLNDGFFAYSCLTELPDGRIACLLEDGPQHITLRFFTIDDSGNIIPEDGKYIEGNIRMEPTFWERLKYFFTKLFDVTSWC